MNETPKAVFTKKGYAGIPAIADQSPAPASWSGAGVFDGNLAERIRRLKAIGGAGFMRSLIATDLIDEYVLATHPVALGSGLPIFTDLTKPLYLKSVDVKSFSGGAIARTYSV